MACEGEDIKELMMIIHCHVSLSLSLASFVWFKIGLPQRLQAPLDFLFVFLKKKKYREYLFNNSGKAIATSMLSLQKN
jgi:hypothetical protein